MTDLSTMTDKRINNGGKRENAGRKNYLKAELFTAYANILVARLQLIETNNRNAAMGTGYRYDKEIIEIERLLELVREEIEKYYPNQK